MQEVCCIHRSLTRWTPLRVVGLVTDAADVDGATAVAADVVVG